MHVEHIAAFSMGGAGGNPAGVVVEDRLPDPTDMQLIAKKIGYSETVFAARDGEGWAVRYYAPEAEVPFCGHATIALGAVLARKFGVGDYKLKLSHDVISVQAKEGTMGPKVSLASPPTKSELLGQEALSKTLRLFGLSEEDLDPLFAPRLAEAGARHAVLALKHKADLSKMDYVFAEGQTLMRAEGWTTIALVVALEQNLFAVRNAFAGGGVYEDPATGAAAAALGGALVDIGWPGLVNGGQFTIRQGEDMGMPSLLEVTVSGRPGDSVRVAGQTRVIPT